MSLRVCGDCDNVINNKTWSKEECPECGSTKMCCPLTDTRDWNKMHRDKIRKILSKPRGLDRKESR